MLRILTEVLLLSSPVSHHSEHHHKALEIKKPRCYSRLLRVLILARELLYYKNSLKFRN